MTGITVRHSATHGNPARGVAERGLDAEGPRRPHRQATIALGGRLTVWPTRPFGVEATFGYAPSGVTMGCRVSDCNAGHVVTGSAKVVVRPIGADSPRSFRVGGGIGIIGLGGTAYDGVATAASVAGTVG